VTKTCGFCDLIDSHSLKDSILTPSKILEIITNIYVYSGKLISDYPIYINYNCMLALTKSKIPFLESTMSKVNPGASLQFKSGSLMKNRFMLAPLTNTQSHQDGTLSDNEFNWLTMRAKGGFGLVMTCASHVQEQGKGFPGQLGIFSDTHLEGHRKLATEIKSYGALAVAQLHHAGMRSPAELIQGKAHCPSDQEKYNARALNHSEIIELKKDFVAAAQRAKQAGYDGVEVHGAHGYILTQFLSKTINQRTDEYGGSLQNRARLLFQIIEEIRADCGSDFLLGVRLSPEKFGMEAPEIKEICKQLIKEDRIDFLDLSLWDCFKEPEDKSLGTATLLDYFSDLDRGEIKLTVAGQIRTGEDVQKILDSGVDFVTIGRSGILHHDFPEKVLADPSFKPASTPVSENYLKAQGLSADFIEYMLRWPDFVEKEDSDQN
jgi:2,4-dienoyl-CoA reductase-like NADH-dependent reductase (Old Yellow Enzyme family)